MQVEQKKWSKEKGWEELSSSLDGDAQLVLVFGDRIVLESQDAYGDVHKMYPNADIVVGSSAGEIVGTTVGDESIVLSAIHFDNVEAKPVVADVEKGKSREVGTQLAGQLPVEGLVHALVFSDGAAVNGTALVEGLLQALPAKVSVTGGLVGDDDRFEKTLLGLNAAPTQGKVVLIGLYGDNLKVSYGSVGGWDDFGPTRVITKSKDNVLLELDGRPALDLYKEYLGPRAEELPASGLLFPLSLDLNGEEVVRTVLSVNEDDHSMTFAGDMPEGVSVKLMKANFDRLIDGAAGAASMNTKKISENEAQLALLVSCIGRRLVLKERTEEELEAVRDTLGEAVPLIGFYSYGEISPVTPTERQCQLHNQTMTVTTFKEE